MLIAGAIAVLALVPAPRIDLDLGAGTGQALLHIGLATVRLAFDFGH